MATIYHCLSCGRNFRVALDYAEHFTVLNQCPNCGSTRLTWRRGIFAGGGGKGLWVFVLAMLLIPVIFCGTCVVLGGLSLFLAGVASTAPEPRETAPAEAD